MPNLMSYDFNVPQPNAGQYVNNALARRKIVQNMALDQQAAVDRQNELALRAAEFENQKQQQKLELNRKQQVGFMAALGKASELIGVDENGNVIPETLETAKQVMYPWIQEIYGGDTEAANGAMQRLDAMPQGELVQTMNKARETSTMFFDAMAKRKSAEAKRGMKEDKTTLQKDYEYAVRNNGYQGTIAQFRREGSSSTNVNVNTVGNQDVISGEANKAYGKKLGEDVAKRQQQATEAARQNMQLDQVALALSGGAQTGFGEETILNLKSLGQTLGLDVGDLSGQELIRTISNEMALRLRNPESGLGLPGNTSNKDLQFLQNSVLGLARTEQGNRAIIKAMRKYNRLRQDVAMRQEELIAANGGSIPSNLNAELMRYVNDYQLFTPEERKEIEGFVEGKIKAGHEEEGYRFKGGDPADPANWEKL